VSRFAEVYDTYSLAEAMLKRYFLPALVVVVLAVPAQAQQRRERIATPPSLKATPTFLALFRPAVEGPAKSVVRVQVDGKDAALGTVVAQNGYVLTKASEVKPGKVSVKTSDGRDLDARVTATSDAYDLAILEVDGSGLTPISWGSTSDAPVGNWVAVPGLGADPVAVGVVSTAPRAPPPPYGPPRVPTEQSGFLGVRMDMEGTGAVIDQVTPESAAEKAGIKVQDRIVLVDGQEIANQESLINTLLGYKAGEKLKIVVEREGKRMELAVTLGKRPGELIPKGKGPNRGDMQNAMGSALSERRTGIPKFFQTDAVVKPADCGGPLVDLDGRAVGLVIARAGRTESHAIPAETVKGLVPLLLAAQVTPRPSERVDAIRAALTSAQAAKAPPEVLAEAKRQLQAAEADEKWWKDRPIEDGPAPRQVGK
jgi:serine protease Do